MQARTPRTPLEAITRRRFLVTGWPWRSLGYLLTTPATALMAGLPLMLLGLPWIALLVQVVDGQLRWPLGTVVLVVLLGAVLVASGGPLVGLPLAIVERWRLGLVDARPAVSGHHPAPEPGLWSWLRTRYTETATWRGLFYAGLLVTVVPVLYGIGFVLVLLIGAMAISPLLVGDGSEVSLGFGQVASVEEALPYAFAGIALIPAVPYLFALIAGAHAATARALLCGGDNEELRARLVEVSRSRARLVDAFEAERRRIERDLHDGAQQRLVGLTLQLGLARLDLPPDSSAARTITEAHTQAKQLMAELRELIRGIHPPVLTDRGLAAALRVLADDAAVPVTVTTDLPENVFEKRGAGRPGQPGAAGSPASAAHVRASRTHSDRLPDHVEHAAYFVVAEALTNVAKHAQAASASVTARLVDHVLVVEVGDDGQGGADPARGSGLTGMADRVAVADGRMLLSSPPGGPTLLRVELPCRQSESG
jgi:signal transduction histidine kinase